MTSGLERGPAPAFSSAHRLAGLASLVVSIAVATLILYGLTGHAGPPPTPAAVQKQICESVELLPEPLERAQYLTGLVLVPVLLFLFYLLFRGPAARLTAPRAATLERRVESLVSAGVIGVLVAGLSLSTRLVWSGAADGVRPTAKVVSIAAALAIAALAAAVSLPSDRLPALARMRRPFEIAVSTLAVALIVLAALFSVFGLASVTEGMNFLVSFNTVFFGVSQVYLGREILHDFIYQYGLFPHFIEPFFRVFGLSVLSFSLLMALLTLTSFLLMWRLLRALVSRALLADLTFVASLYFCYFAGRQGLDQYYQYFPVRFVFPVLSLFLAARYYLRGGALPYYASFVVGSVAVLWNYDTGVVVLLAWLMTLVFQELVARRPKKAALHLLVGLGVFAATVGAYSLAMVVHYGHAPDYLAAFEYQRLYYLSGFGMLPMPTIHPWNVVILLYAAGLLFAGMHLAERRVDHRTVCVFHLCVLGAGIFSYYQGRSVNGTLACVSYPAFILAAVFADRLLDERPAGLRAGRLAPVGVLLFALAFSGVSMARITPTFIGAIQDHFSAIVHPEETLVIRNARFVKERTHPGEEVLMLSYLSGIYHLESGTLSPRGIGTITELPLKVDVIINAQLNRLRTVPKIFLGSEWDMKSVRGFLLKEFNLAGATPDGSMLLLTPR